MLKDEPCHAYGPKVKRALEAWDHRRRPWDVVFHVSEHTTEPPSRTRQVAPEVRTLRGVHIPKPNLRARPNSNNNNNGVSPTDPDARTEWDDEVAELFEWVGLACLGSERFVSRYVQKRKKRVMHDKLTIWV